MKKYIYHIAFILSACSFTRPGKAQHDTSFFLKEPAAWEFERFSLPPVFAPAFPYAGVEELRFSPGMFRKEAADYFSYAFVAELDNRSSMSAAEVQDYLTRYYKGLCAATAKDRKLTVDTTAVTVTVSPAGTAAGNATSYKGIAHVFGVFADGAGVDLNLEVTVFTNASAKKTLLFFLVSPAQKETAIWDVLYSIRNNFRYPVKN